MKLAPLAYWIAILTVGTGAIYWLSDARQLRGHSAKLETENAQLEHDLRASQAKSEELGHTAEVALTDAQRLEAELAGLIGRQAQVAATVEAQRGELIAARKATNAARAKAMRPMPEGVRITLVRINQLLRQDGHDGFRFVWSERLVEQELRNVELLVTDQTSLKRAFYMPDRVTLRLDRASGELILGLFGGRVLKSGAAVPIGDAGHAIVLAAIDGPKWETLLPQVVQAEGEYPKVVDEVVTQRLSRNEARDWMERIDHVLGLAKTPELYRVDKIRGVDAGRFQHVLVLGYSAKLLTTSVEAASLEFRIDPVVGSVSLILRNGLLRKKGGETNIPASGYRILLPGVTGEQVSEAMMGMVIRK